MVIDIVHDTWSHHSLQCMKFHRHTRLTMYYIRALIYDFLSRCLYVLVLEALRSVLETLRKYTHIYTSKTCNKQEKNKANRYEVRFSIVTNNIY